MAKTFEGTWAQIGFALAMFLSAYVTLFHHHY